eukprot:TRINITY_DN26391_c0_g1_i1.p1 TRINITY_DN26391_c0_g1~~TRINITY_DN26391_c0_g1_i1.p1  ORF type:complete len:192 (+),score=21.78 TRINITY_DN26391_c0_g1_i1:129-704(+)
MVSKLFGLELVQDGHVPAQVLGEYAQRWVAAQWILVIAALALLILESTEWRSPLLVGLLVPLVFINAPSAVFEFFRGTAGHWIAFIVVLGVLYTPSPYIPAPTNLWASIILLFVAAPGFIVGVRYSIWGILISFVIALVLGTQHVVDSNRDQLGPMSTFRTGRRLPTTIALVLTIFIPIYFTLSYFNVITI